MLTSLLAVPGPPKPIQVLTAVPRPKGIRETERAHKTFPSESPPPTPRPPSGGKGALRRSLLQGRVGATGPEKRAVAKVAVEF